VDFLRLVLKKKTQARRGERTLEVDEKTLNTSVFMERLGTKPTMWGGTRCWRRGGTVMCKAKKETPLF